MLRNKPKLFFPLQLPKIIIYSGISMIINKWFSVNCYDINWLNVKISNNDGLNIGT